MLLFTRACLTCAGACRAEPYSPNPGFGGRAIALPRIPDADAPQIRKPLHRVTLTRACCIACPSPPPGPTFEPHSLSIAIISDYEFGGLGLSSSFFSRDPKRGAAMDRDARWNRAGKMGQGIGRDDLAILRARACASSCWRNPTTLDLEASSAAPRPKADATIGFSLPVTACPCDSLLCDSG